jgi:DNA-binding transcriptional LysR family regulator
MSQLRCLAVLAEERHFGRAARRLGMAQPSLTHQISRLEAAVGYPLLSRRPSVALTPAGEQLVLSARRVLQEAASGVEAARLAGRGEAGRLTLGFGSSALLTGMGQVVRGYGGRFPGVDLQLREVPTSAQAEALRSGAIDVGIGREPSMPADVATAAVLHERFLVALPDGHPLAARRRIALAELRDQPIILFPRAAHPVLHDRIVQLCRESGFEPRIVQESTESLAILAMVDLGLAASLVPESFRRLRVGNVRYRPLACAALTASITVCWRHADPSATVGAFVRMARERAAS